MNDYLLQTYLAYLRDERRRAVKTVKVFGAAVRAFLSAGHPIDADGVRAFLRSLTQNRPKTVALKLSALKSFARWLHDDAGLLSDGEEARVLKLRAPHVPKSLPRVLSPQESARLLDYDHPTEHARRLYQIRELRDQALLELYYGAGVRVGEAVGLDLDDVCEVVRGKKKFLLLTVLGKGSKERRVPAGRKARTAFLRFLGCRAELAALCGPLDPKAIFVGIAKGRRISTREGYEAVRRRAQATGIYKAHPHAFRHSYATDLLDGGADLVVVRDLLGHDNLSTTSEYLHTSAGKLLAVYGKCHPRA